MNSFYSEDELKKIGFRRCGTDVYISRKCSIYSAGMIEIGNHVRIDDFCILSGKISLGDYIHIAAYTALYGGESGIIIKDYANVSSRVSIYSITDDYSGESMSNPMIPEKYKRVFSKQVKIGSHVIIGASSVVMPGVEVAEGGSFGAFSFVNRSTESWSMYVGIPCRKIKNRRKNLLALEEQFRKEV